MAVRALFQPAFASAILIVVRLSLTTAWRTTRRGEALPLGT